MFFKHSIWLTAWLLLSSPVAAEPAPATSPDLKLSLIWNDAYKLLPISYEKAANEVTKIFEAIRIQVRWTKAGQDELVEADTIQIRVVLMPRLSSGWSLDGHTMGVVIGKKVPRRTVFIFYPSVLLALGYEHVADRRRSPRERANLTRALGRVVAHEIVHAILPEREHDKDGLLSRQLKRRNLQQARLPLANETAFVLVERLAAWQYSGSTE